MLASLLGLAVTLGLLLSLQQESLLMSTLSSFLLLSLHALTCFLVQVLLVSSTLVDAVQLTLLQMLVLLVALPVLILLSGQVCLRHSLS